MSIRRAATFEAIALAWRQAGRSNGAADFNVSVAQIKDLWKILFAVRAEFIYR
jgi:hypothetical protein